MEQKNDLKRWTFGRIFPEGKWRYPIIISLAAALGIILTIFRISNAHSYLSDDPVACVNCHIMSPEYATWFHSSHGRNTVCNDCHVPHDNFFRKYWFKANDGLRHATMFTFRLEPQVIHINKAGKTVVQENCIRCHDHLVSQVKAGEMTYQKVKHGEGKLCWDCHREVPHGRVHSLASAPHAKVPVLSSPAPDWLTKMLKNENNLNKK